MADSWEEQADEIVNDTEEKPASFSFNPKASSFSFNPSASSFAPGAAGNDAAPAESKVDAEAVTKSDEAAASTAAAVDDAAAGIAGTKLEDPPVVQPTPPQPAADRPAAPPDDVSTMKPHDGSTQEQEAAASSAAAAVQDQQEEEYEDEEEDLEGKRQVYEALAKEDARIHMNVVFIGHVDAGKSTLGGQILVLMGGVDERTIEKYQKEAKDNNRETWYMAYVMDTNDEERAKGKTVEVGRAHFSNDSRRYTILDAPGHKNFVPNMIQGASQADMGVLVISARKGEFETGYEKGGQTREHALLAKTLGVQKLIVVVNKMDDPSISKDNKWSQERYDDIVGKLTPFLKGCGYNPQRDLVFLPIAALTGGNVLKRPEAGIADWWKGPTLFQVMDKTEPPARDPMASFRMPVINKYKDMGCVVEGKSESGVLQVGHTMVMMPNATRCKVTSLWRDDDEVQACGPGENLKVRLSGVDDSEVGLGFVLSGPRNRCPVVTKFQCQLQLLELLDHKSIFTAGYKSMLHIHSITEECEVVALEWELDKKTKQKKRCKFAKSNAAVSCRIAVERAICVETFEVNPQMGRFTMRDEGRTIAIGKVTRLPPGTGS